MTNAGYNNDKTLAEKLFALYHLELFVFIPSSINMKNKWT